VFWSIIRTDILPLSGPRDLTGALAAWHSLLRRAGAVLICFVAFFAQGAEQASAFIGSAVEKSVVRISSDSKGVAICYAAEDIDRHFSCIDGVDCFLCWGWFSRDSGVDDLIPSKHGPTFLKTGCRNYWKRIGQRKSVIHNSGIAIDVVSGSLPGISNYSMELNCLTRNKSSDVGFIQNQIRTQLPFGSFLGVVHQITSSKIESPSSEKEQQSNYRKGLAKFFEPSSDWSHLVGYFFVAVAIVCFVFAVHFDWNRLAGLCWIGMFVSGFFAIHFLTTFDRHSENVANQRSANGG
jgi:hypothetical protein